MVAGSTKGTRLSIFQQGVTLDRNALERDNEETCDVWHYGSWSWIWCWRKVLLIIFLYVSLSPYRAAFQQQQKSSLQFDMFGDNKSLARHGVSNESFQKFFFSIFFFLVCGILYSIDCRGFRRIRVGRHLSLVWLSRGTFPRVRLTYWPRGGSPIYYPTVTRAVCQETNVKS